jgi:acyl-CoA thioester hydrolase
MARVEIKFPEKFLFATEIPIRISDINRGRHLAFHMVLSFTEEARTRFWKHLGYTDENMNDVALIVVDAAIMYRKQGFYGQTLRVEVALADFTTKGCDMIFRMTNADTGEEMFRAKTGMLFFNYGSQKVVPVPEDFKRRVAALEAA